jgi:AraC-like DNA-binding protein
MATKSKNDPAAVDAYLATLPKKGFPDMTYTYIRHSPSRLLHTYIDYFYYIDGSMPYPREKILPFPTLDLKINLGGAFRVYEADSTNQFETFTDSWWVGLYDTHHSLEWPPDLKIFGVGIKPAGAYPLLQLPLSELHNRVVPLDAIWGHFADEIRERLEAAPTIQAGFTLLEQLLLARLREAPLGWDAVQYAVAQMMQSHGTLSIHALSDHIGISQNHLGNQFKRLVGVTPKEMARLIRFKHVLHSIDPVQSGNWARIAHQCGYYDQSHFNKDFVAFTGYSPTDYLQLRSRAHVENTATSQGLRRLPY